MSLTLPRFIDWSLRSIFDRVIDKSCPIASNSEIRVALPAEGAFRLLPDPNARNAAVASYNVDGSEYVQLNCHSHLTCLLSCETP